MNADTVIERDDPVRAHIPVSGRRSEARRRVRIRAAWPFVDGGHLFNEGVTECILYETDIARIRTERMPDPTEVRPGHWRTDETKIEEAKSLFEQGKQSFLDAHNKGLIAEGLPPLAWEQIAHDYEGPRTWQALYVQRNFAFANVAGYKAVGPLREIEVGDEILPPLMSEAERMQLATVSALTRAMNGGEANANLLAEVAQLREQVAALLAAQDEKAARKR